MSANEDAHRGSSMTGRTYRETFDDGPGGWYGWISNRGYPTRAHRKAIMEYGPTDYHRRTFRLLDEQMSLDL